MGDHPRTVGVQAQRPVRLTLVALGGIAAGLILAFSVIGSDNFDSGSMGAGQDAWAYWHAVRNLEMYGPAAGTFGAYLYSPAFVQIVDPVLSLPWQQFIAVWTWLLMAVLVALAGPMLFILVLPLAFMELWGGNIHLLLALAIVLGFRYPAAWAFVLLTKVTPGIGLLWFAVRREWRHLAIAGLSTAAVVALSWLWDPGAWLSWLDLLWRQAVAASPPGSIAIPLGLRLPVAAALVAYAAHTDRRWLVPVGVLVAMPVLWWGSLSLLIACVALERERIEAAVFRTLAQLGLPRPTRVKSRPVRWVREAEAAAD